MSVVQRQLFIATEEFTPEGEATLLGKVRGVGRDHHAGFLPTNTTEKNNAFELLDYAKDHQDDRLMPQHRLQEIFKHQVRLARQKLGAETKGWLTPDDYETAKAMGQRSVKSVALVWGDFLANAQQSAEQLSDIGRIVRNIPNPAVKLFDEVPETHPGVGALVRFVDLSWLRDHVFPVDWGFDPLRPVIDRIAPTDSPDLRHKYVHDPYTAPERSDEVAARIAEVADGLSIVRLRNIVPVAIVDQQLRTDFWQGMVNQMHLYHMASRDATWSIIGDLGLEVPRRF